MRPCDRQCTPGQFIRWSKLKYRMQIIADNDFQTSSSQATWVHSHLGEQVGRLHEEPVCSLTGTQKASAVPGWHPVCRARNVSVSSGTESRTRFSISSGSDAHTQPFLDTYDKLCVVVRINMIDHDLVWTYNIQMYVINTHAKPKQTWYNENTSIKLKPVCP